MNRDREYNLNLMTDDEILEMLEEHSTSELDTYGDDSCDDDFEDLDTAFSKDFFVAIDTVAEKPLTTDTTEPTNTQSPNLSPNTAGFSKQS